MDKFRKLFQYQVKTDPIQFSTTPVSSTSVIASAGNFAMPFQRQFQYQSLASPVFTPTPHTVAEADWHQGWSIPDLRKRGLPAHEQQYLAYTVQNFVAAFVPIPDAGAAYNVIFNRPISSPFTAFSDTPTAPEVITEDKWHQGWSVPDLRKRGLPAHEQQALAYTKTQTTPEVITEDKWHQAWSIPRDLRKAAVATQQFLAFCPPATAEAVTEDRWHQQWSIPDLRKRGLPAHEQQFLAFVKAAPFPELVLESKWHQGWSIPDLRKRGLATHEQRAFTIGTLPIVETLKAYTQAYIIQ